MALNYFPPSTMIQDPGGTIADVENNNALAVSIQDQTTKAFDTYFSQVLGTPQTLAEDTVLNEYTVEVEITHGITVGDQLVIYDSVSNRLYIGGVLVVSGETITLDTPLNYAYPVATSTVLRSTREMDVNGSVTRQTFQVKPPIDKELDITRIMFKMITTNYPELDMFGDITGGLTRGIVMRSVDGENVNYYNVKTNGELVNLMYDVNFYEAAKHGSNGLGGRLTYAGPSKHGVTIRLAQNDILEVIIQDDLSSLLSFRMIASGHLVGD